MIVRLRENDRPVVSARDLNHPMCPGSGRYPVVPLNVHGLPGSDGDDRERVIISTDTASDVDSDDVPVGRVRSFNLATVRFAVKRVFDDVNVGQDFFTIVSAFAVKKAVVKARRIFSPELVISCSGDRGRGDTMRVVPGLSRTRSRARVLPSSARSRAPGRGTSDARTTNV